MSNKLKIKQVDLSGVTQDNSKTRFLAIDSTGNVYWNDSLTGGGGGGSIDFYDEGTLVGTYSKVNFVGVDILGAQKPGDSSTINVYVPTPTFASHFNTLDGTSSGLVAETLSRANVRISTPTSEGTPFKTGTWAGTTRSATLNNIVSFSTANAVTGQGGDATVTVDVYDADGVTIISTFSNGVTADGTYSSTDGIDIIIAGFIADSLKEKADITVTVDIDQVLSGVGLTDGGKYNIVITNLTDSTSDGAQTFTYTQPAVFFDTNLTTPSFGGGATCTIEEKVGNIVTKHLSGVEYYTLTSQFSAHVDAINDLNANTQGRALGANTNFQFAAPAYGLSTISEYAWAPTSGSFTGWTNLFNDIADEYDILNWAISSTSFRYRGTGAAATASLFEPWTSGGTKSSTTHSILVDTYATSGNSTQYIERFDDEAFRLESDYTTVWDPTATLSNGEACVVGGTIVRPDQFFLTSPSTSTIQPNLTSFKSDLNGTNPNYTSLTASASYYRKFYTTLSPSTVPIPNFSMVFAGTFAGGTALADLISGALVVIVRKIGATGLVYGPTSYPLFLNGAQFNPGAYNEGLTNGQIRTGGSVGNTILGTFGGFSATNGIYVEFKITNPAIRIDTVTVTFN
jgi:hypothetical protein